MSENAKVRAQELYGQPFGPSATAVPTDVRIANALEYIASQVGEIRRSLEALNKRGSEGTGPACEPQAILGLELAAMTRLSAGA